MINTIMALWNQRQRKRGATVLLTFLLICISISLLVVIVTDPQWLYLYHGSHYGRVGNSASTSVATQPFGASSTGTIVQVTPTVMAQLCATPTSTIIKTPTIARTTIARGGNGGQSVQTTKTVVPSKPHPTPKPTTVPHPKPTATPIVRPTPSVTPTAPATPPPTETPTPIVTPTETPTPVLTPTPTGTSTGTPTSSATATATPIIPITTPTQGVSLTPTASGTATYPTTTLGSGGQRGVGNTIPALTSTAAQQDGRTTQRQDGGGISNCLGDSIATPNYPNVVETLKRSLISILVGAFLGTALFFGLIYALKRR